MSGPSPAVAQVRRAVRESLADLADRADPITVLVAVSGGADSMALAAALLFEARALPLDPAAVVVDHALQPASGEIARRTAGQLTAMGYPTVEVCTVAVSTTGSPEAAARDARYAAIDATAGELDAAVVLLGHTLDDQAESVLLGLARGSGAGSIKGMSTRNGRCRRPLLAVTRAMTRRACLDESLPVWDDPHNVDERFTRVRVRQRALPALEDALGPGVAEALARTAASLRVDDAALTEWAGDVGVKARLSASADGPRAVALDVDVLAQVPEAVRLRVIRQALHDAGVPGGDLRSSHLRDVDSLVCRWKGQGEVHLPGRFGASRSCGRLLIAPAAR
jgi:tRNA(Ile)-lysidine synthase